MKKIVSNTLEDIGKCRDLILTGDYNEILKRIYLFEKTFNETKVQIDKYIKRRDVELDFTPEDLRELAQEIYNFIKNYQQKFLFEKLFKELSKEKLVDIKKIKEFSLKTANMMYVDRKLREAYKIFSFWAFLLYIWTEADKQDELDFVVTDVIRSFL